MADGFCNFGKGLMFLREELWSMTDKVQSTVPSVPHLSAIDPSVDLLSDTVKREAIPTAL